MNLPRPYPLGLCVLAGTAAGVAFSAAGCADDVTDNANDAGVFEAHDSAVEICGACVATECTAAWALCLTDDACLGVRRAKADAGTCACANTRDGGEADAACALYNAFAACSDERTCANDCARACADRCSAGHPTTAAACETGDASSDLDASSDDAATDAGLESDADASASSAPSCTACANAKCSSAKKACTIGSECTSFLECTFGCTDSTCEVDCARLHATGKVAAAELAACTRASCEEACGL
jgi:hypothetical protein